MNSDQMQTTAYLQELCSNTQGNIDAQASMYDIGLAIGIDKTAAGKLAEELMVQGYVELKTLSGGIGITTEGLSFIGHSGSDNSTQQQALALSTGPIANDADRKTIETIIKRVQQETTQLEVEYPNLEQIVLDLKAMEIHLLTGAPKTAVLRALLASIADCFQDRVEILQQTGLSAII